MWSWDITKLKGPTTWSWYYLSVERQSVCGGAVHNAHVPAALSARFGSVEQARALSTDCLRWYNTEHRHSGLGLHTPHDVHGGLAAAKRAARAVVLSAVHTATPKRFVNQPPTPPALPIAAWINPPKLLAPGDVVQ